MTKNSSLGATRSDARAPRHIGPRQLDRPLLVPARTDKEAVVEQGQPHSVLTSVFGQFPHLFDQWTAAGAKVQPTLRRIPARRHGRRIDGRKGDDPGADGCRRANLRAQGLHCRIASSVGKTQPRRRTQGKNLKAQFPGPGAHLAGALHILVHHPPVPVVELDPVQPQLGRHFQDVLPGRLLALQQIGQAITHGSHFKHDFLTWSFLMVLCL